MLIGGVQTGGKVLKMLMSQIKIKLNYVSSRKQHFENSVSVFATTHPLPHLPSAYNSGTGIVEDANAIYITQINPYPSQVL